MSSKCGAQQKKRAFLSGIFRCHNVGDLAGRRYRKSHDPFITFIHSKHQNQKPPIFTENFSPNQPNTTAKMVLKIHGVKSSTCTRRVLTALYEKGVPYEFVPVNFANGEHKSPKHMALQPFGKVPAMDDDGFILFESRAIAKYIAKKYAGQGATLLPAEDDLKAYGLFEQVNIPRTKTRGS